jgi:rare lipoprotein A
VTLRSRTNSTVCGALVIFCQLQGSTVKSAEQMAVVPAAEASAGQEKSAESFSGNVSWYGPQFHGRKTASGETFDMNKATAAHKTLDFGTKVLVEDPRTGKTVLVKVNDRGPYVRNRVMDLAQEGARQLGTLSNGVVYVDCLIINRALPRRR